MNTIFSHPVRLLIVDDSLADRTLFKVAFDKANTSIDLHFCDSGQAALNLLQPPHGRPQFLPDVCLVDVKMPAVSGHDVLKALKTDVKTQHISVFMLSSSDNEKDVDLSFKLGASGYFQKPRIKDDLDRLVGALLSLWSGASRFPKPS